MKSKFIEELLVIPDNAPDGLGIYSHEIIYYHEGCSLIKVDDYHYIDPFYHDIVVISRNQLRSYFKRWYNLELYQVYNLVNGLDENQIHLCPVCDNILGFRNLATGFGDYCSLSCANSAQLSNRWSTEEFRSKKSNEMKLNWSNPEWRSSASERLENQNLDPEFRASNHKSKFISLGDPSDECYFYLAINPKFLDWHKFGVSSQDPVAKKRNHYLVMKILFTGTRSQVAEIEYQLHCYFESEWVESSRIKEFNKKYREVISSI